jgi:Domain of unknown function (DUF4190)
MTVMDPRCVNGHPVAPGAGFCTTCGSRVDAAAPDPRRCPSGHPVAPEAGFCTACGAKVAGGSPALPSTMGFTVPPVPTGPPPSRPMAPKPAAYPPGVGAYATVSGPAYAQGASAPSVYGTTSGYAYAPAGPISTLAIAAFITSIVWLYGLTSVVAIVLAVRVLRQLKTSGERGRPLAITAIVFGVIGLLIALGVLLAHA